MNVSGKKTAAAAADCFWKQGYNCAESVFVAGRDAFNLSDKVSPGVASGFGGGVGGCGSLCGALSGSVLVIGLVFNRTEPKQKELYAKVRVATKKVLEDFEKKHGSVYCKELTGYDFRDPQQLKAYFSEQENRKRCLALVESATRIMVDTLGET